MSKKSSSKRMGPDLSNHVNSSAKGSAGKAPNLGSKIMGPKKNESQTGK